jgi:hypothetical protein
MVEMKLKDLLPLIKGRYELVSDYGLVHLDLNKRPELSDYYVKNVCIANPITKDDKFIKITLRLSEENRIRTDLSSVLGTLKDSGNNPVYVTKDDKVVGIYGTPRLRDTLVKDYLIAKYNRIDCFDVDVYRDYDVTGIEMEEAYLIDDDFWDEEKGKPKQKFVLHISLGEKLEHNYSYKDGGFYR